MAKLHKKVKKLIDTANGGNRLRKTLVEYNLGNIVEKQALSKGDIFYRTWKGYFSLQHERAMEEDVKRQFMEAFTK